MYHVIVGTIVYDKDEDWQDQATISNCIAVAVEFEEKDAERTAEFLSEVMKCDYLIPQLWRGRIYNMSEREIPVSHTLSVLPKEKIEWAKYYDIMQEFGLGVL